MDGLCAPIRTRRTEQRLNAVAERIGSAPSVWNQLVTVGHSGSRLAPSGRADRLDATTDRGEVVRFVTGDGDPTRRAKTTIGLRPHEIGVTPERARADHGRGEMA